MLEVQEGEEGEMISEVSTRVLRWSSWDALDDDEGFVAGAVGLVVGKAGRDESYGVGATSIEPMLAEG